MKRGKNDRRAMWPATVKCANPQCPQPGGLIPDEILAHRHRSLEEIEAGPHYCSRACVAAYRQASGNLKQASAIGNAVQSAYKEKYGHPPGPRRGGARQRSQKPQ